jgi:hypothetical protein
LDETYDAVDRAAKTSIINDLTPDIIENFEYTRYCFYESLRIEPPVRTG